MSQDSDPREKIQPGEPSFSDELSNALEYAWGPVGVSLLLSLAFAFADPAHEAIVALAENIGGGRFGRTNALFTIGLFVFVPATLFLATKIALNTPRPNGPHAPKIRAFLLTWVGRLPLVGVVAAILRILATDLSVTPTARGFLWVMLAYAAFAAVTGIAVLLGQPRRERLSQRILSPATAEAGPRPWWCWLVLPFYWVHVQVRDLCVRFQPVALTICGAAGLLIAALPETAGFLGPIGTALIFASLAAVALAWLTRLSPALGYGHTPLFALVLLLVLAASGPAGLVAAAVLSAVYGTAVFVRPGGAGRAQRIVAAGLLALIACMGALSLIRPTCEGLAGCNLIGGTTLATTPPPVAQAFAEWHDNRPPEARDQPVRVIAAPGGGLFTAYLTATYLAKRADLEGASFTGSIFAISGVSGGSVGAAVFWAILRSGICDTPDRAPDCHLRAARAILAQDYLSPVLAGMLTRDLIDTVLPYSALSPETRSDRGELLERLLARRTAAVTGADSATAGLDSGLAASWRADAGVPALFLNATDVHTGDRLILSPFSDFGTGEAPLSTRLAPDDAHDFSVASAAVMSARFPVVTPPARMWRDGQGWQIVDGGYYDNSGIETISDIIASAHRDQGGRIEVVLLQVDERDCWDGKDDASCAELKRGDTYLPRRPVLGMLGAPFSAFTAAWTSRRDLSQKRMLDGWRDAIDVRAVQVAPRAFNFTVSWFLGHGTFCRIELELNGALRPDAMSGPQLPALNLPADCGLEHLQPGADASAGTAVPLGYEAVKARQSY